MNENTDFRSFYERELAPRLAPLETRRRSSVRLLLTAIAATVLTIILFFTADRTNSDAGSLLAVLLLVGTIILFVLFFNRHKAYVNQFKESIVREVIRYMDPALTYRPRDCVQEPDYRKSGLYLTNPDLYEGDDYVEGWRDKTFFCFSELHTQQRVSSGKNTHYVTLFRGLFFIADFHKHFRGRTFVWSEKNPQLNFFNKIFSSFARGLDKVKLESPEFEKRFIVYSTDQVEARYILTPSMMERLVSLQDRMGDRVTFSFVDTNVYVAVPMREALFEPAFVRPNSYTSVEDYYLTVQAVFGIIDELRLNLRIWTKE